MHNFESSTNALESLDAIKFNAMFLTTNDLNIAFIALSFKTQSFSNVQTIFASKHNIMYIPFVKSV